MNSLIKVNRPPKRKRALKLCQNGRKTVDRQAVQVKVVYLLLCWLTGANKFIQHPSQSKKPFEYSSRSNQIEAGKTGTIRRRG